MCSTILTPGSSQVGPFVLGAPIRLAANLVAKKAQSKSLEGAPLMLPIGLVAEGRGPRSSPLYPKVLGPAFQRGGAPCFAPQAVLTARIKSKNPAAPAVKREAEEDWKARVRRP